MPKTIECVDCRQVKTIHARGLCGNCYSRNRSRGTLDQFGRKRQPRIIQCPGCGQQIVHYARGLCLGCYHRDHQRRATQTHRKTAEARKRAHIQYMIGEVEFLAGTDSRENLAKRLGYASCSGLQDFLKRHNRLDLWEATAA